MNIEIKTHMSELLYLKIKLARKNLYKVAKHQTRHLYFCLLDIKIQIVNLK